MEKPASVLISELNVYFSLYPIKESGSSLHATTFREASKALGRLSGSHFNDAVFTSDAEKVILEIISHCDDETQEELIYSFGDESLVSQIIRRNRIEKLNNVKKTTYSTDTLQKNLQNEIMDIRKRGNPLYESICHYIEMRGYRKDSDFYNAIGMPRQQFARLRDAANTLSKKTVLWIIVGLRLNYNEACDVLGKAGYNFRKSDMRDVILMYIFRNTEYSLRTVNEVLDHFGLDTFC